MNWALFLAALIATESGGDRLAVGDNGQSYGVLQIQQAVVEDVNRVYGFGYAHTEMFSEVRSRHVAIHYLRYWGSQYEKRTGRPATPEVYARIWNGGPTAPINNNTTAHWHKVRTHMMMKEAR